MATDYELVMNGTMMKTDQIKIGELSKAKQPHEMVPETPSDTYLKVAPGSTIMHPEYTKQIVLGGIRLGFKTDSLVRLWLDDGGRGRTFEVKEVGV